MRPFIGVLFNRGMLRRSVRGMPTFERVPLYVKAARELDVDIVFFEPDGVRLKDLSVVGYVPSESGKLKRKVVPIPLAVHKRGIFKSRRHLNLLRRLENVGAHIFNPEIRLDKYEIYRIMAKETRLQPYLPSTVKGGPQQLQWLIKKLAKGGEVFVKPRRGSLGLGIARIASIGRGRYRFETPKLRKKASIVGVWKRLRAVKNTHILQAGIPLLEDGGRRVDFRVPVQLGGDGQWHTPGIAAKRAERVPFLTNLARGGSVHNANDLLARQFGEKRANAIIEEIYFVATLVAQTLHARFPRLVDLGLDIGVDRDGTPFVIEVNRRDLRILLERAGEEHAFAQLYKNPLAYARSVLRQRAAAPTSGAQS